MQLRGAGSESEGCAGSGVNFVVGRAKVRGWGQQVGSDGVEHLGFVWRQRGAREDSRSGQKLNHPDIGDQLKTQGPKSALHNLQSKKYPQVWKLGQTSHTLMNLGDGSMETCYIIL